MKTIQTPHSMALDKTTYWIGPLLGATFFFIVFGSDILYPRAVEWLLQPGNIDAAQHFLGWEFFRHESWHWPLGLIEHYGFPTPTSIVYLDTIPWLALFAKAMRDLCTPEFQYFGVWLLGCCTLQGYFGWRLSQYIHPDQSIRILITCFFITSPIFLNRTIAHQALASQWLLLATLWLYPQSFSKRHLWIGLSVFALMTHAYLFIMIITLEMAYLYKERQLIQQNIKQFTLFLGCQLLLWILIAWIVGYFVINLPSVKLPGYSVNSMNLLAPFIPTQGSLALPNHWSIFLNTLGLHLLEQGDEGFNYFGIGMLSIFCIALFPPSIKTLKALPWRVWCPWIIACLLLAFISLSNRITWENHVLYQYTVPPFFRSFSETFRAPGRFFWPMYYLMMFAGFKVLSIRFKKNIFCLILCITLCMQWIDLSEKFQDLHAYFQYKNAKSHPLPLAFSAKKIAPYQHLVFLPWKNMPERTIPHFQDMIYFAAQHHLTVNTGYFARMNTSALSRNTTHLLQQVLNGTPDSKTLYIITEKRLDRILRLRLHHNEQVISYYAKNK